MKVINAIGNGEFAVHEYKHKIVVFVSKGGRISEGGHWNEIKTIKGYGSRKK